MLSTLNIALCSLRLILPYSHAIHTQYCLMLSTLLCSPRSLLPYAVHAQCCSRLILPYSHAVHAQYCLMLSTLAIALCCPRLILLYRHAVLTEYCLMLSMLNIALCWQCSMISTLNIALCSLRLILPYAVHSYAVHAHCYLMQSTLNVHAQYCLVQSTPNIALQPRCTRSILPFAVHARYCLVLSTLNIALQTRCPHWILPYAVNAQYCLMLAMLNIAWYWQVLVCLSSGRTCSSCLDLHALLTALAIYLRLWLSYLYYTILPKALTTLASIHQYIHTSTSNINNTATHTLTCNMINNNITCSIIKDFIIHSLTLLLTYSACVLSRCASKYMYILTLTHLIIGNMSGSANKYILTLLPYILKLLKPQMVHLLMP